MEHQQPFAGDADFEASHKNSAEWFHVIVIKADEVFQFVFITGVTGGANERAGFQGRSRSQKIKQFHWAPRVGVKATEQNFFNEQLRRKIVTSTKGFGESFGWHKSRA
jgi:hypothetical protein